jgi:DNA-directed RNA polymerase specialized sigma24 family protein
MQRPSGLRSNQRSTQPRPSRTLRSGSGPTRAPAAIRPSGSHAANPPRRRTAAEHRRPGAAVADEHGGDHFRGRGPLARTARSATELHRASRPLAAGCRGHPPRGDAANPPSQRRSRAHRPRRELGVPHHGQLDRGPLPKACAPGAGVRPGHGYRRAGWRGGGDRVVGPDSAELRAELADCLAPLTARLPELYREALDVTEFQGITQAEAAGRLGLSVSGMKARVQRGRAQLKDLLLDCCDVELDRRRGVTAYRSKRGSCATCGRR